MNKKLMAAAVAGALAVPAGAAMAQTSSVQIYGLFNVEYAPWVDQPNTGAAPGTSRTTVDALNSGASRIGFRGQEKLGGSLTAWFQCETDVRFLRAVGAFDRGNGRQGQLVGGERVVRRDRRREETFARITVSQGGRRMASQDDRK